MSLKTPMETFRQGSFGRSATMAFLKPGETVGGVGGAVLAPSAALWETSAWLSWQQHPKVSMETSAICMINCKI